MSPGFRVDVYKELRARGESPEDAILGARLCEVMRFPANMPACEAADEWMKMVFRPQPVPF